MTRAGRVVSLSAGTVLPIGPETTVDAAADAGFDHVGIRLDPAATDAQVRAIRARLDARGVAPFDVEVVRLGVTDPGDADRLAARACELGAAWLLVTSHLPDPADTARALAGLVERLAALGGPTRAAFEYMRFTEVHTVYDAVPIARAAGAGLVVDPLHTYRAGHGPEDVRKALGGDPVPLYLQLCDTDRAAVADGDLADEARRRRLLPGTGLLPLRALLAVLPPDTAVTAEVQAEDVFAAVGPVELARRCRAAVDAVLAS